MAQYQPLCNISTGSAWLCFVRFAFTVSPVWHKLVMVNLKNSILY